MRQTTGALLAVVALATALPSCQPGAGYRIEGSLRDGGSEWVYLQAVRNNRLVSVDSTAMRDGEFTFRGAVDVPDLYAIRVGEGEELFILFLENSPITVEGHRDSLEFVAIAGSAHHDVFDSFSRRFDEMNQRIQEIAFRQQSAAVSGILTPALQQEFDREFAAESERINQFAKRFVLDNSHSPASAFIAMRHLAHTLHVDALDSMARGFPESLHQSTFVRKLIERVEVERRTAVGQPFIDFTLPDPEGVPIALGSLVGSSYLLIDFWASWCGPCRVEKPYLVKAYQLYKPKGFGIISVSLDYSRDEWLQAVAQLGVTWPQVSDLAGWDSPAAASYGIMSIPSNVLLDSSGVIVAKNLRGEQLVEALAERLP